jgi:hypothetical protein
MIAENVCWNITLNWMFNKYGVSVNGTPLAQDRVCWEVGFYAVMKLQFP